MKARLSHIFPFIFLGIVAVSAAQPGLVGMWKSVEIPSFVPLALLGSAIVLSLLFAHARIAYVSCLVGISLVKMSGTGVGGGDEQVMATVLSLSIGLPIGILFMHLLPERPFVSAPGIFRFVLTVSMAVVLWLAPSGHAVKGAAGSSHVLFQPVSLYIPIPWLAVVVLTFAILLLLFAGRAPDSAWRGAHLSTVLLFATGALTVHSPVWRLPLTQHVMVMSTGATAMLVWCSLRSVWEAANVDELTRLPGRKPMQRRLGRLRSAYSLALVDVDHFKRINDRYGHDTGDQVLRYVAACLKSRSAGNAYRYGGEEFVVVIDHGDIEVALERMDTLRKAIAARQFRIRGKDRPSRKPRKGGKRRGGGQGQGVKVRVSIGLATRSDRHNTPSEVLDAADKALYTAKRAGRNRVKVAK